MSYLSRLFNHRNTQQPDKKKGFFSHRRAADDVVHRKGGHSIQKLSTPIEDEKLGTNDARILKDKEIQEKPMEHPEEEKMVQKKDGYGGSTASTLVSSLIESRVGKGAPLSHNVLTEMNSAFGVDFGCVRIHTDSEAVAMCRKMGAQAFTHGKDIYFNQGKYDPDSSAGKHLLSHELTHVIQQLNLPKQTGKHGK